MQLPRFPHSSTTKEMNTMSGAPLPAPLFGLDGCVAIVTGAGRGMGRGVAGWVTGQVVPLNGGGITA